MKTFPFVEALLKATTLAKNAPVSHVLPQLELFINFEAKNGFIGIDFAQWTGAACDLRAPCSRADRSVSWT